METRGRKSKKELDTFSIRLKELRNKKEYIQPEIADKLNVSLQVYQKWEQNKRKPPFDRIVHLAEILDCDTDYLLGLADKESHDRVIAASYTGLTENALKKLHDLYYVGSEINIDNVCNIEILSLLLINDELLDLLEHIHLAFGSSASFDTAQYIAQKKHGGILNKTFKSYYCDDIDVHRYNASRIFSNIMEGIIKNPFSNTKDLEYLGFSAEANRKRELEKEGLFDPDEPE